MEDIYNLKKQHLKSVHPIIETVGAMPLGGGKKAGDGKHGQERRRQMIGRLRKPYIKDGWSIRSIWINFRRSSLWIEKNIMRNSFLLKPTRNI